MRELTYGEAVREALAEEMRRDPRVFLIGEDVAEAGHPFKVLTGLVEEFGKERVIDTPISEPGYAGIGVGAAMTGMRPVVDVMFGDFITLAMDQIVNQAAKVHYMSGGKLKVPIVFRTTLGATRRSAAQHSQSLHDWVSHIPGLKVALPSTPYEAKGLMKTAIRDDSPVVIFEDKMMYRVKGPVPAEEYTVPFGVADVKRAGTDVTIVATSSMVLVALAAATMLEEIGISAEVIDPRTTFPLDKQTLIDSARKTSRVLVVDEGYERYGVTAEIASVIAEQHGVDLAQVKAASGTIQKADVLTYLESQKAPPAVDGASARLTAASPKARRLAAERSVDIRALRGSGPGGAILAADIPSAPSARPAEGVGTIWRIMAERMTASWTTAPHFYLFREVTVGRLVFNVGLAVAIEDGLVVPVIHRADTLSLADIAARREDVVSRGQAGKLRPADIQGGGFTISNLGMYGVDAFNAIVNPPQAAILAVGRIADRVVAVNGEPAVQPTMMLTLSCDHRALD
ncbi:MAG: hypothetical protein DMD86_19430, partial [Candidatus Rokuibacteriota bacterium]